jgi:cyclopropane-fatty-acyl-phospholipid synthase
MGTKNDIHPVWFWAARKLLDAAGRPPVRIALWNGQSVGVPEAVAVGRLHLHDRAALLRFVFDPELEFGDLYVEGRLSVGGDLVAVLAALQRVPEQVGLAWKLLPRRLVERALHNDPDSARQSIYRHYDLGNDFFELWLDERLLYTCAYFPTPQASLEAAQLAKMDHVCRKLELRPGQRVIEAGCGWGALALHMARRYGVTVRAYNISRQQVLYAREQAEKQGLAERVEFLDQDYRDISGRCDAFVSVGMLEHVGASQYRELGSVIERCLAPEGRGLIHTIGRARPERFNRWFERRVFPNAYPPTLREIMNVLEPYDFVPLDVENLRLHYALTGRHWLDRFERNAERIEEMFDPAFVRKWRLYLACVIAGFEVGTVQLFQVLFARSGSNAVPWTREPLYTATAESPAL